MVGLVDMRAGRSLAFCHGGRLGRCSGKRGSLHVRPPLTCPLRQNAGDRPARCFPHSERNELLTRDMGKRSVPYPSSSAKVRTWACGSKDRCAAGYTTEDHGSVRQVGPFGVVGVVEQCAGLPIGGDDDET